MLICKQFIDTYTCLIPACNLSSSMNVNMTWLLIFYLEFLLFTKFVSLSVIPSNRKNISNTKKLSSENYIDSEEESHALLRQKRDDNQLSAEDEDEEGVWEPICKTITTREPLAPLKDSQRNPIFRLTRGESYTHFVKVMRCDPTSLNERGRTIGDRLIKCEQKYKKHTVVIFDQNTQKLEEVDYWIDSGCEAKMAHLP